MITGDQEWWDVALSQGVDAANAQSNAQVPAKSDAERAQEIFTASQQADWTPAIPVVTPDGNVFRTLYSQYWMDPTYTGPEPSTEVKAAYSTADYARNFAGTMADIQVTLNENTSPIIQAMSKYYPSLSTADQQTGQVNQAITPQTARAQVPGSAVPTTTTQGTPTAAEDLVNQLSSIGNAGLKWLSDNLLLVIVVVSGIILVPRLLSLAAGSGRRGG